MKAKYIDIYNDKETTILLEGLKSQATLVHITDNHLNNVDERDTNMIQYSQKFEDSLKEQALDNVTILNHFKNILGQIAETAADCMAFTGDIIHFPSSANLEIIKSALKSAGLPYIYALGNHEHKFWDGTDSNLYQKKFRELFGKNPLYHVCEVKGIRLIAIDNSDYQVTKEQLEFLNEQFKTGMPCLLFMHVPIYIPSLEPEVLRVWKAPVMLNSEGWTEEDAKNWGFKGYAEKSTASFYKLLMEANIKNLLGIFCGHLHFPHSDEFGEEKFQISTGSGNNGYFRIIRIKPFSN